MSLRKYLLSTYSVFICIFIIIFSVVINFFVSNLFEGFVKKNIETQNTNIVKSMQEQFISGEGFNPDTTKAVGMSYVHQGYIITLEDPDGNIVWDARECDMHECAMVIADIEDRMSKHNLKGQFQTLRYELYGFDGIIGYLNIETYNPYFYNESESEFMFSLNLFLLIVGALFLILSVIISTIIATALSTPILKAAGTAKKIAGGNLAVKIMEKQPTKELQELISSVNELSAALEKGEKWNKRLSSDIAHELRTPLTILQGTIEAMIDGISAPAKEKLESCHEEILRLGVLVDGLNTVSLLETNSLVLQKTYFNISELVCSVIDCFEDIATEKNIRIDLTGDKIKVYADCDKMKQVLVNLLSNAVKYTDKGYIKLSVAESADVCVITVQDTGIGISAADLPHIFERFYRSDITKNKACGTGIGLTIAKAIVEAHNGEISSVSQQGAGSIFSVKIPKT